MEIKAHPKDRSDLSDLIPGKAKIRPARPTLLLPYQARWVADDARLKIAEKARQIGWTWASAYGMVRRKCQVSARLDGWISSRDEIQARLFLEDCKSFAQLLDLGAIDEGARILDEKGHSAFALRMANGLRIHSMSSNPNAQAGKRGDRILDEFALHPDPRKLYAIAYPGITWGGSLEIFSTHRGTANYFNELIQEIKHHGNPKGFSLHSVSLQTALDQGFLHKLQRKLPSNDPRQGMDEADYFNFIRAGCPDEESFLQEYCCAPSDDRSAFLSYELITGCETDTPVLETGLTDGLQLSGPLFLGVDIGREHDLTVLWALEQIGDVFHTRALIPMRQAPFDVQEGELYRWLKLSQLRRCCIDQTGIGRQLAERAQQRFGKYRVEGLSFTAALKESLAYPVRAAFERRALRIPADPALRADLRAIKKEATSSGNIRFAADRGRNGHADRFWALALALHAGKTATVPRATVG